MNRFKKYFRTGRRLIQVTNCTINYVIPFGLFVLFSGMFWVWNGSKYNQLYYLLVSFPACMLCITSDKDDLKQLLKNPLMVVFLLFGFYTLVSLIWSDTDTAITSLIRRPINIFFLFFSLGFIAIKKPDKIQKVISASALLAVLSGLVTVVYGLYNSYDNFKSLKSMLASYRFSGFGVLDNALLTSHVYGFFTAFFIAVWFNKSRVNPRYLIFALSTLFLVILTTGSRTPLLALTFTSIWLAVSCWNKRSLYALLLMTTLGAALFALIPQRMLRSGLSWRPEIWEEAIKLSLNNIWFGQGYDHNLQLYVEAAKKSFYDPHNIELGVLLAGGLVGLTLWMIMYATALTFAWKNRKDPMVSIASATVVFGLAAGFTEGGGFMSRPNEHWFLIWIPLALLYATWVMKDQERRHSSDLSQLSQTDSAQTP